eukprot:symbB.v1.2.000610.t1/scaffold26.1/size418576/25
MAPLVAETPAFEAAEIDVSTVKKSRAASPAPKGKEKEGKEMMASSPSAEKASKVEKKPEPAKTEKVEKKIRFGTRSAVGIAALLAVLTIVALCFFMPAPLNFTLTTNYMIVGLCVVAVAVVAGTVLAVKKFKFPIACKKQS